MSLAEGIAIAGVSMALAIFIKYGFMYLVDRKSEKVIESAVERLLTDHRDELIESIKLGVLARYGIQDIKVVHDGQD